MSQSVGEMKKWWRNLLAEPLRYTLNADEVHNVKAIIKRNNELGLDGYIDPDTIEKMYIGDPLWDPSQAGLHRNKGNQCLLLKIRGIPVRTYSFKHINKFCCDVEWTGERWYQIHTNGNKNEARNNKETESSEESVIRTMLCPAEV